MADEELPLQPLALLVYEDGSVHVESMEDAVQEMIDLPGIVRAYAFMGAEFIPDLEVSDEPVDSEE